MLKPDRTHPVESGVVFCAMPFGTKLVGDVPCDFDVVYNGALVPAIQSCGMTPERLDSLYGPQGVLELIWRAIQRAEIVVIDFSQRNANVTFEYGVAWTLGKRVIALTQDPEDIPSDVRGLNRYIRYSQNFVDIEQMKQELALQLEALRAEPSDERAPTPYFNNATTVPAPATIITLTPDYALVETDDKRYGILRNVDADYTRLVDLTRRFAVGERLEGAFIVDAQRAEARYTLVAGQTNPWPVLASRFPVGTTFTGVVRRAIAGVGLFVHLDADVNGLVPAAGIAGPLPLVGDPVEVVVTKMDATHRRASLRLKSMSAVAGDDAGNAVAPALPAVGYTCHGTVVHMATDPEGGGRGYLLVELPGYARAGKLPAQHMSDGLHAAFLAERIDLRGKIHVEVILVDPVRNRIILRDVPDAPEPENEEVEDC